MYLLTHWRISCWKLTKFGVRLAKCNIYLWYFPHKVKMLTPSCHKRPAHTVIWIWFLFTDTRVHFCWKLTKFGVRLAKCNIYLYYFLHKVKIGIFYNFILDIWMYSWFHPSILFFIHSLIHLSIHSKLVLWFGAS